VVFSLVLLLALASPATAATPAPTAATPAAGASHTLVGEVLSVDVENRRIVVAQAIKASDRSGTKARETLTVHVPFSTRVLRGKNAASLGDVKPRDHAVVRYRVTPEGAQALSLQLADLATPTPLAAGGS
jgi:hypothetical protein